MPVDSPTHFASDTQQLGDSPVSPGILSRNSVFGGYPGVDCSVTQHFDSNSEQYKTKIAVLRIYRAFDLPPLRVRQSLYEAFFERCWTWMPVVDCDILQDSSKAPSILLQQAMLLAGSRVQKIPKEYGSPEDFYQRTKALLDTQYEPDVLSALAALCMIQWYNPAAPTDISAHSSKFWVTYAVGLAQQLGLHRRSEKPVEREGLRRRIWWCLYVSYQNHYSCSFKIRPTIVNIGAEMLLFRPRIAWSQQVTADPGLSVTRTVP